MEPFSFRVQMMMTLLQLGIVGDKCPDIPTVIVVIAFCICVGGLVSYIPQHITLIRAGRADGISEKSLFFLMCSQGALVLNSLILNWTGWYCFQTGCSWWRCLTGMLSFLQICVNFLSAIPVWLIFLRFKLRDSNKACLYDLAYALAFLLLLVMALIVSLVEKHQQNLVFFAVFARVLGIGSAIVGALVWVPQIVKLIRTRNPVGVSFWMFLLQSLGGIFVIVFQAVLYDQDWTTWIGYVFVCLEQITITVLLVIFKVRNHVLTNIISEEEGLDLVQDAE